MELIIVQLQFNQISNHSIIAHNVAKVTSGYLNFVLTNHDYSLPPWEMMNYQKQSKGYFAVGSNRG